jgi:hypothetical protein
VVQVSDTRISTLSDRKVISERQRKSIIVMGDQARFVLGWVGLATCVGHNTGDWIYQQLYGMDALDLPLDRIAHELTGLATKYFATLPVSSRDRRCHFVLGGWHKASGVPRPFTCVIYNDLVFHAAKGNSPAIFTVASEAMPGFLYSTASFQAVKRPFHVFPIGDISPKTRVHFSGLKSLMKKEPGTAAISAVCRQIALEAANHTTTIGRNLISTEMDNKGIVRSSYYSEEGTETMIIPDILSKQGTLLNATLGYSLEGDQITVSLRGKSVKPGS